MIRLNSDRNCSSGEKHVSLIAHNACQGESYPIYFTIKDLPTLRGLVEKILSDIDWLETT